MSYIFGNTDTDVTAPADVEDKADKIGIYDIEITDGEKGIILKSPNGTRFRLKLSDDGALLTQPA